MAKNITTMEKFNGRLNEFLFGLQYRKIGGVYSLDIFSDDQNRAVTSVLLEKGMIENVKSDRYKGKRAVYRGTPELKNFDNTTRDEIIARYRGLLQRDKSPKVQHHEDIFSFVENENEVKGAEEIEEMEDMEESNKEQLKTVCLYLSASLVDQLKKIARFEEVSASSIVNEQMAKFIKEYASVPHTKVKTLSL